MRKLIVHRERALACFAMKYHCVVDRDREEFLRALAEEEGSIHLWDEGDHALKNGQTISIELGEGRCTFFVVACLDGRDMATETVVIGPGGEDVYFTVVTDYDGNRRLAIRVEPGKR